MKTMKHSILMLAMAGCTILAGCASDDSGDKGPAPEPAQVKTLSVEGLNDDQWVYISLETGRKIGTSPLGDAAQAGRSERARSATPRRTPPGKPARTGTSPSAAN